MTIKIEWMPEFERTFGFRPGPVENWRASAKAAPSERKRKMRAGVKWRRKQKRGK